MLCTLHLYTRSTIFSYIAHILLLEVSPVSGSSSFLKTCIFSPLSGDTQHTKFPTAALRGLNIMDAWVKSVTHYVSRSVCIWSAEASWWHINNSFPVPLLEHPQSTSKHWLKRRKIMTVNKKESWLSHGQDLSRCLCALSLPVSLASALPLNHSVTMKITGLSFWHCHD